MNNSQQDIPVIDIPAQTHPWSTVLALAEATEIQRIGVLPAV